MTLAPCPRQESLPQSLEECDERFLSGVLLIKDAVLGYAQLGLNGVEISKRVAELGGKLSKRTAQEYLKHFREAGLLKERELSQEPEAVKKRLQRAEGTEREICALSPENPSQQEPTHDPMTPQEAEIFNGLTDLCAEQEEEIKQLQSQLQAQSTTTPTQENDDDRVLPEQPLPGCDDAQREQLAEHWVKCIANSTEPDSWKEAMRVLGEFELLLSRGYRDGWSQSAYDMLRTDLEGYARSCASSSGFRRERLTEEVDEIIRSGALQRAISGSCG